MDRPPPPWILIEAAALHLGKTARTAHVFPEEPGEALSGVSLFVLLGDCLARLFGEGALWRILTGSPLEEVFPAAVAAALTIAGWQELWQRREPPLVRDALSALEWVKLADATRSGTMLDALLGPLIGAGPLLPDPVLRTPELLAAAARLSFGELPWYQEEPTAQDEAIVAHAVTALFQVNRMAPLYQTHPAEPPGGLLFLDVPACLLFCAVRPEGVFAEPARWIFPPPLARRLARRGARRVLIRGAARCHRQAIAQALLDLALGSGPLAKECELRWTSSPA